MNATRGRRGGPGPTGPAGLEPGGLGPEGLEPSKRDPIEAWLSLFVKLLGVRGEDAQRIRDELEDHLRSRVDDLMIAGADEQEAVRRAVSELGETVGETAALARRFRASTRPMTWRAIMQTAIVATLAAGLAVGLGTVVGGGGGAPTGGAPGAMSGAVGGVGAPAMAVARGGSPAGGGGAAAAGGEAASVEATAETSPIVGVPSPTDDALRAYEIAAVISLRSISQQEVLEAINQLILPGATRDSSRPPDANPFVVGAYGPLRLVQTTLLVRADPETHLNISWFLTSLKQEGERQERQRAAELPMLQAQIREIDERLADVGADIQTTIELQRFEQTRYQDDFRNRSSEFPEAKMRELAGRLARLRTQEQHLTDERTTIRARLYHLGDPAAMREVDIEERRAAAEAQRLAEVRSRGESRSPSDR